MKYLKLFETDAQYESWKDGSDYVMPSVSYTEDGNVYYNPIAIKTVFDSNSYEDRKALYEYLASIIGENVDWSDPIPVELTLTNYQSGGNGYGDHTIVAAGSYNPNISIHIGGLHLGDGRCSYLATILGPDIDNTWYDNNGYKPYDLTYED